MFEFLLSILKNVAVRITEETAQMTRSEEFFNSIVFTGRVPLFSLGESLLSLIKINEL